MLNHRCCVLDDLRSRLSGGASNGDLLLLVAEVELGEVARGHEANEFFQLANVDHGGGIVMQSGSIVWRSWADLAMIMPRSCVDHERIMRDSLRIVPELPGSFPNTPNRARRPVPLLRTAVRGHAARRSKDLPEDERAAQAHSVANQEFGSHRLCHAGGSDAVAGDPGRGDRVVHCRL